MCKFKILISLLLLLATPMHLSYPQAIGQEKILPDTSLSYDETLALLASIESGVIEEASTPEELEQIMHFVASLARKGLLPEDSEEDLSRDIAELLDEAEGFALLRSSGAHHIFPAIGDGCADTMLCKSWIHKQWKKTKKFIKEHKKAIIIGAAIVIAAAIVVAAVAAAPAAAAGAVGAAGATGALTSSSNVATAMEEKAIAFKDTLSKEELVSSQQQGFALEEKVRTLGSLFSHESLYSIDQELASSKILHPGHSLLDSAFSTDYTYQFVDPGNADFRTLSYRALGEAALETRNFPEALEYLNHAIALDPNLPITYLDRGFAHLANGDSASAVKDYRHFIDKNESQIASPGKSFSDGLLRGIRESPAGFLHEVAGMITSPTCTATQIMESFAILSQVARSSAWESTSQALVPEARALVAEWEAMPHCTREDLAGYVFGKHGGNLFVRGQVGTAVKERSTAYIALKKAKQMLALETASAAGMGSKVADAVQSSLKSTVGREISVNH